MVDNGGYADVGLKRYYLVGQGITTASTTLNETGGPLLLSFYGPRNLVTLP